MKSWEKLTFQKMRWYTEIARLRSLRQASRSLKTDPSQLSRFLGELERTHCAKLVQRNQGGISLTERGLRLKESFESILSLAETNLAAKESGSATFSVCATAFLNTQLVAPVLARLSESGPYSFRTLDVPPDEIVSQGIRGAFEAAVHVGDLDWPKAWATRQIGKIRWNLYCRRGHALARKKKTTADKVAAYRLVYPIYWTPDGLSRGNDHCPLERNRRLPGTGTATADAALMTVVHGNQLAFLPDILCREENRIMALSVAGWPTVERPLYLTARSLSTPQKLFETFASALKTELRD